MAKNDGPPFTHTNDSITVVHNGRAHVVQRGAPNFLRLRKALIEERWGDVPANLTVAKSVSDWARGRFTFNGRAVYCDGNPVPEALNARIVEMAAGNEDPTRLFKFWERLTKNPSMRSVEQLFPFLLQKGIPFTEDGRFLAYKSVQAENLKDHHSNTFRNKPGDVNKIPRNQVSDDPNHACHEGFHVGALEYAQSFGGSDREIVICEVDPENVVCVPYDSSQQKMRVCEYTVVGFHNGQHMPSTSISQAEVKPVKPRKKSRFDSMDTVTLLSQSLESLRKYASHSLNIVGVSRILGGKVALVARITTVRANYK
ncbi:MAG: hypothetical protein ACYDHY_06815 [Acidiferrobacterales bacterium]